MFVAEEITHPEPKVEFVSSSTGETDTEKVEKHIKILKDNSLILPDDYDTWFNIGMSLNAAFGEKGRTFFHSLSSLSPKYDKWECDEQYDKIIEHYADDTTYSLGTLMYYFKEAEQSLNY